MFRRRSAAAEERRIDALHAARIDDLKEAHAGEVRALNKVIEALAEQVEFLRIQLHLAPPSRGPAPDLASSPMATPDAPLFLSEEEEEALALHEMGQLSDVDLARVQEALNEQFLSGRALS